LKTRDIIPTYTLVKAELTKRLKGEDEIVEAKREFENFIEFIDYYIDLCREGKITNIKGGKITGGSIRNYLSTQSALRRYITARKTKLTFESLTIDFYNDFVAFLNDSTHSRGKYKPNVIEKFIKEIKVMMRYAYENGYTLNEDFKNRHFKVLQEQAETVYLNEEELAALYALELPVNKAQIRDNFLISCYTSLRYSDISRLERRHINFDNNTIVITTQKTGAVVVIPITLLLRRF
ncbi:MAG: phage integrase SAM-like domain-containing protein, partial [Mucinivorans sp.]